MSDCSMSAMETKQPRTCGDCGNEWLKEKSE